MRNFRDVARVEPAAIRLKKLREAADPALSVRKLAQLLGMPASTYAFYEDPKKFKKAYLPIELTKSLAQHLTPHGIDQWDVLALGGFEETNAPSIEASIKPVAQFATMQVLLPDARALERMFLGILKASEGLPQEALARELAQLLPRGLGLLQGPLVFEQTDDDDAPQADPEDGHDDRPARQRA